MYSLEQLVIRKAEALTEGDVRKAVEGIRIPTTVYIDKMLVYIRDLESLRQNLHRYRGNLLKAGYDKTIYRDLSQMILGPQAVRVSFDWIDLDHEGKPIHQLPTFFYCVRNAEREWSISMVHIDGEPRQSLLKGIELF
jgi:hypothetical protein